MELEIGSLVDKLLPCTSYQHRLRVFCPSFTDTKTRVDIEGISAQGSACWLDRACLQFEFIPTLSLRYDLGTFSFSSRRVKVAHSGLVNLPPNEAMDPAWKPAKKRRNSQ